MLTSYGQFVLLQEHGTRNILIGKIHIWWTFVHLSKKWKLLHLQKSIVSIISLQPLFYVSLTISAHFSPIVPSVFLLAPVIHAGHPHLTELPVCVSQSFAPCLLQTSHIQWVLSFCCSSIPVTWKTLLAGSQIEDSKFILPLN